MCGSMSGSATPGCRHPGDLTRPFPRAGNWVCKEDNNILCLPFSWVTALVEVCKSQKLSTFGLEPLYTFAGHPMLSLCRDHNPETRSEPLSSLVFLLLSKRTLSAPGKA